MVDEFLWAMIAIGIFIFIKLVYEPLDKLQRRRARRKKK